MRILDQKDLKGKSRIDMEKYKRKSEKRLGGRVEIPLTAACDGRVLAEALPDSPPDIVDRAIVGHLDSAELEQLGLKAGWFVVFGERA
jgi:hypothetical protein